MPRSKERGIYHTAVRYIIQKSGCVIQPLLLFKMLFVGSPEQIVCRNVVKIRQTDQNFGGNIQISTLIVAYTLWLHFRISPILRWVRSFSSLSSLIRS